MIILIFQKHAYKVKIVNPLKKSDVVVRLLHNFQSRFSSVIALRTKLIEEFKEMVPTTLTFNVGYFEGQKHSKMWICVDEDLTAMYQKYPTGDILLWCDSNNNDGEANELAPSKRRREEMQVASKRQEREEEVDQLKEKHSDKYDIPKLRLWARMMASSLHDSIEEPPNVPAFGSSCKKPRTSFSEAISGAAIAFAKVLGGNNTSDSVELAPVSSAVMSPGRSVELRMKNFEQLRYLQQLHDDGVLTASEYAEQKQTILTCLRKL